MPDVYAELKDHFARVAGVTVNAGSGAQGMKLGSKMFVMFYRGQLIVQLPPDRISALIASGNALPHDPGTGKPMRDRALIPASKGETWIDICEESMRYAQSRTWP